MVKLYEPSPTPCLYVAPAENMVGRVPLMPLFLAGNATPTIPHLYSKRNYEVNPWLWQFGRGKPRLGGLLGEATEERKQAHRDESRQRGVETLRLRKADRP